MDLDQKMVEKILHEYVPKDLQKQLTSKQLNAVVKAICKAYNRERETPLL